MGNLELRSVYALFDKPSTCWLWKQSRKQLSWTLQKEQPCLGREKDYGWDCNLPHIEDVFVNWVWRTHYSPVILSKTHKSNKWNNNRSASKKDLWCMSHGWMGLKTWRKAEPSFSLGNKDATVHSPPVGCQMDTYFHGGYLTINWT